MSKHKGHKKGATKGSKQARTNRSRKKQAKTKWVLGGVLLAAVLVAGFFALPYLTPTPAVVQPADASRLDPAVDALLKPLIQKAEAAPREATLHADLGLAYEANGLWKEASQSYANALQLDKKETNWQLHKAIVDRQAGDFEGALANLQTLATRAPQTAVIQNHYGEALLEAGDIKTAESVFRTLVQLSPGSAQGYVGLGDIMLQQGAGESAVQVLEQAVALDPRYKQAQYLLGRAYSAVGREAEATAALEKGVDAKIQYLPDALSQKIATYTVNVSGRISQASTLLDTGNPEQAARLLEESYIYHNTNVMLLNTLASAYLKTRRLDDAHRLLNRAQELDQNQFFTYLNLYTWALRSNKKEEALQYADEAIARAPERDDTHLARAQALAELGRLSEALESAKRALEIDGSKAGNHGLVADINYKQGNLALAALHFEEALTLNPNLLPALVGLANIRMEEPDLDAARTLVQRASRLAPNHPRVQQLAAKLANAR